MAALRGKIEDRPRGWLFLGWVLLVVSLGKPLPAAYIKRYSTVDNGAMTYTGNTLGLSKRSGRNEPGTSGSIGTFSTTNTALRDGTYPYGTTSNWTLNSASAQLHIPAGSTVLYAELIWGGSYNYGGQNVSAFLNDPVTFITPLGTYSISPDPATAQTLTGGSDRYYYVRSADVTAQVQAAGAGTYTTGRVPGTEGSSEDNSNAAGWTLAVIYSNPSLPARNMTIFVGAELTSSSTSPTSSVTGFCTPRTGPVRARMMVSAIEGDSNLTGDQMRFGPTPDTMAAVSGPNNPLTNFFASQINGDDGLLDTAGTFGTLNHTPGSNGSGRRQGWDITNVDVSAQMTNGQNTAYARGTTSGDRYTITSIGLQIDVGAPVFPSAVLTVDKTTTYVGDVLTYTARLDNTAGSADALNVRYTDIPPTGTSFIPNTFTVDGVVQPGADPVVGVDLGTVAAGAVVTVSYQVLVEAIPSQPLEAEYRNDARWTYQFESCPGFPLNNGTVTTNAAVTGTPRLEPVKTADPPGKVSPGGTVTYTISVPNTGTANTSGTTLVDAIPEGTTYVPNSTTLNGTAVPDVGGQMPFTTPSLINSPGEPAGQINVGEEALITFQVTINPDPPAIITNIATIDVDGPGPAPSQDAVVTNPPVEADLAVAITDGQTAVVAGNPITYLVTVTNYGPDAVIRLTLNVSLPSEILNPTFTPSTGLYNSATGVWGGLNLAAGQSITLTVSGTIDPAATNALTATAQVTPPPGIVDPNLSNNSASDTDTLSREADLAITKTDGRASTTPGSALTYTITVTNNGPSLVKSLTVVDTLPATLLDPVFTPSQGTYNTDTGAWTGLNLGPGQQVTLTLTGTVDLSATGTIVNTVTVSPPTGVTDPNTANNSATDTDSIGIPNLSTSTKTVTDLNGGEVSPGDVLEYTITVTNTGTGDAGVTLTDTLPTNTSFVADAYASGKGIQLNGTNLTNAGDADAGDYNVTAANAVTVRIGTVAVGGSATVKFQVLIASGVADGTGIPNTANLTSNEGVTASPSVQATVAAPVIAIEKAYAPTDNLKPGTSVTYTITVTNRGTGTATEVVVADTIPDHTTYVPGSIRVDGAARTDAVDGDNAQFVGNSVSAILASLGGGQAATVSFQATVN